MKHQSTGTEVEENLTAEALPSEHLMGQWDMEGITIAKALRASSLTYQASIYHLDHCSSSLD